MTQAWIQSYTGRRMVLEAPDPAQIDLEDIAHALSQVCRFGGHSKHHYSVAQHSLLVSQLVRGDLHRHGLLHDAAEAYIGDLVTPLKKIPGLRAIYLALEDRWLAAIGERFGLGTDLTNDNLPPPVKFADFQALVTERRDVLSAPPEGVTECEWLHVPEGTPIPTPALGYHLTQLTPSEVKVMFLRRAAALGIA